jgi:hypothetical protein
MKMTSNGRQPKNIKRAISQQQLVKSHPNLKLEQRVTNKSVQRLEVKMIG